jgi:FkbM family methyltransferase
MIESEIPMEPITMRAARLVARMLPMGRATVLRRTADILRCPREFLAVCGDFKVLVDIDDIVSCTLYNYGVFEPAVTDILAALIKPGDTVFDVGANFGLYTLLAARQCGSEGKVYAFEPDPRNIARLRTNVQANDWTWINIVPKGLYHHAGTQEFFLANKNGKNLGTSSLIGNATGQKGLEIELTTVDEFTAAQGIKRINVLKMDIEGAELGALRGATTSLQKQIIDRILLEFHPSILGAEKSVEIFDLLSSCGYRGWYLRESGAQRYADIAEAIDPVGIRLDVDRMRHEPHVLFSANDAAFLE